MATRQSAPVQFGVLVALLVGIAAWPVVVTWLLRLAIGTIVPGWVLAAVCYGFICSATVAVFGILFALPVLWLVAALYDRGYLPEAW